MAVDATARGPRFWRRRVLVLGAVAALATTGAGTLAAYQLSIPPFQTVDAGTERMPGVPVHLTTVQGTSAACEVFLELGKPTEDQRAALAGIIASTHWTGAGQRIYDGLPSIQRGDELEAIETVVRHSLDDLTQRARAADPSLQISGTSSHCNCPSGAPK